MYCVGKFAGNLAAPHLPLCGSTHFVPYLEDDLLRLVRWHQPPAAIPRPDRAKQEGPMAEESYTGEAYCVKCKAKREFTGHVEETNGRRFAKGICPTCGTKVTRILGKA